MTDMIAVGVLGVAAVLLAMELKTVRAEFAAYLALGAGLVITWYTVGRLSMLAELFNRFMEEVPVDDVYVTTLLKMIGITYTVQFCVGLCRDAGYGSIAGQIETFGKLTVLSIGVPILFALLDTVRSFLYTGV